MLTKIWSWLDDRERMLRRSFGTDISTPGQRRLAWLHYHMFDHAALRTVWTNFFEVAPGVYRSNQPTHARFARYRDMGVRTVINLRGEDKHAQYLFEKESCEALGLTLVNAKLWARQTASRARIQAVIDAMRAAERPFLFHCKSGADRAGFAAAVYLMVFEGVPVEEAKAQLGLKYIHFKGTRTGVQDYILDVYAARLGRGAIPFEDWIAREYDHKAIQAGFDARRPPQDLA
ncbi:protein tyrosine phosphatase [Rhodosalinus halophilus]|uniref:Protein tyrosine phosphatase n=1 Tax=Rhodosalinus halophilus TaxID=2259333 RepID=A0A365UEA8_9RHOB|nr:tyrosine-protein phosphatase [Rhodosalinus halophilus]RBI87617.1 protein tyrosine phosphatase [Rhodosalinus halophilus]